MFKFFIKKFWLPISTITIVVFALIIINFLNSNTKSTQSLQAPTTITPTPYYKSGPLNSTTERIYPLQKTIINITQDSDIQALPDIIKTEILPNGEKRYSLTSPVPLSRPNLILTQNGVAIFERIITNEANPSSKDYATVSEYKNLFGNPEKTIKGSKYYGNFMNTYVYSSRGFAFIGNPNTDETYEVQTFVPMSADQYMKQYGQDIDLSPPPGGP